MGGLRHAKESGPGDDDRRGARAGGHRKSGTPSSDSGVLRDLGRLCRTTGERCGDGRRAVEAARNREGRQDPARRAARLAADFADADGLTVSQEAHALLSAAASEAVMRQAVRAAVGDRHDPRAERLEVAPAFRRRQVQDDRLRRSRCRARSSSAVVWEALEGEGGCWATTPRRHPARAPPRFPVDTVPSRPVRATAPGLQHHFSKPSYTSGSFGAPGPPRGIKTHRVHWPQKLGPSESRRSSRCRSGCCNPVGI